MKTNKTTSECTAYNLENKAAIETGLLEAVEPNEHILAQEAKEAALQKALFQKAKTELAILQKLDPKTDGRTCLGVRVQIEKQHSGSTRYSSGYVSGWKMIIGDGYGRDANKTWCAIGDGTTLGINAKQLAKAQAKLAEVKAVEDTKNAARNVKQSDEERTKAFITAHPEFCNLVGQRYYCGGETYYGHGGRSNTYTTAFICLPDGKIKIGHETFTISQWTEIYDLRNAQAEAMKALKASFTPAKQ